MFNRQPLAEAIEEFLESCNIAFIRIFRSGRGIGEHASVKEFIERLIGVPQIIGEHCHAPCAAFGSRRHDLDRGVECGRKNLLGDLRGGEDAAMSDEGVDCDTFVLGHDVHADLDRRERAEQLGAHEVA